jgi:hypothetical protein
LSKLSDERLHQVLEFATQLSGEEEDNQWRELGQHAISQAYGPDEPEYTESDLKVRFGP